METVANARTGRTRFMVLAGGRTEADATRDALNGPRAADQDARIATVLRSFGMGGIDEGEAFRAICRLAPTLTDSPDIIWDELRVMAEGRQWGLGSGSALLGEFAGDAAPRHVDELALRRDRTMDHRPTG